MERVIVKNLKIGDKFKLFEGAKSVFTVIDTNPVQYKESYRCKGEKITFPINITTEVIKEQFK